MHPIKIAIVEDEAIIASLLFRSLEKLGYNIVGLAVNYAEAVEPNWQYFIDTSKPLSK